MANLFDLTGKTAIVTGSSRGIGKAIAHRMAEHGANVVVSSRKADACEAAAAEINDAVGRKAAIAIPCNIAAKEALQNLVDETNRAFGQIDILRLQRRVESLLRPDGQHAATISSRRSCRTTSSPTTG